MTGRQSCRVVLGHLPQVSRREAVEVGLILRFVPGCRHTNQTPGLVRPEVQQLHRHVGLDHSAVVPLLRPSGALRLHLHAVVGLAQEAKQSHEATASVQVQQLPSAALIRPFVAPRQPRGGAARGHGRAEGRSGARAQEWNPQRVCLSARAPPSAHGGAAAERCGVQAAQGALHDLVGQHGRWPRRRHGCRRGPPPRRGH
mmetsp:Transcript_11875/g.42472  ORF Transcript_11875/g.42472 Transcript_11875/m.42472 type:complete len:200 (-) Transcript_11875:44-643(-)